MLYPTTLDVLASQSTAAQCEATTPWPDKGRLIGEPEVLLVSDTIPFAFPVPDGLKLTIRVTYWPGAKVTPAPIPLVVNAAPESEFCCRVSALPPVLERVTPCVVVFPTATSPKSTLELYMVKIGNPGLEAPPPPPQPVTARTLARRPGNQSILVFIRSFRFGPLACAFFEVHLIIRQIYAAGMFLGISASIFAANSAWLNRRQVLIFEVQEYWVRWGLADPCRKTHESPHSPKLAHFRIPSRFASRKRIVL